MQRNKIMDHTKEKVIETDNGITRHLNGQRITGNQENLVSTEHVNKKTEFFFK